MNDLNWQIKNAISQIEQTRQRDGLAVRTAPLQFNAADLLAQLQQQRPPAEPATPEQEVETSTHLLHHGDIAIAALKAGHTSHYQLWLLARLLDAPGRGWHRAAELRQHITTGASALYKWPRMRQLLNEGNGRFWVYDKPNGRIWLRSTIKVAYSYDLSYLIGRFTKIDINQVRGRTQSFKAHCFAAWLQRRDLPISQDAIERQTGLSPRTQRRYIELANITRHANICVGPQHTPANLQQAHWHHSGVFQFTDYRGYHGGRMSRYVAWHLPSHYDSNVQVGSQRQARTLSNRLTDLARSCGALGNGSRSHNVRLFCKNGRHAAQRFSKASDTDAYWPAMQAKTGTRLWHALTENFT